MILATQEMIKEWTEKGVWGKKTLIDYFKENVSKNPDEVCIVDPYDKQDLVGFKPDRLTYRELDRAVDATAEGFLEMGIQKDDIVVVQLPNCWELAMLYLAITKVGGLISPMPMQWRISELEYIARLAEPKAFITVEEFYGFKHKEMGEKLQSEIPSLRHILTLPEIREMSKGEITGRLDSITSIDANDIFTLCWSSGTEAYPKGCPLSHNNWISKMGLIIYLTGMNHEDKLLTAAPMVNMVSVGGTFIPWLILGNKLVLHHPFSPSLLVEQLFKEEVTFTLLVPAVVNGLLKYRKGSNELDLSNLRMIGMGGAPPSLWAVKELRRRWGTEFVNQWGQNENPSLVSGPFDIPDVEKRIDNFPQLGKPGVTWSVPAAKYIQTKIKDPDTGEELTKIGSIGELWYRGPNIIPCYFRSPDITEKSFDKDGFFNTGDMFEIKEGNCIGFFDRTKDIIIRGGFNISAQEVENILLGHPKVVDVAAVAIPDDRLGERTCVYVVPKKGNKVTLDDIVSFMEDKGIAVYKFPERLEFIEEIPRNPAGKILKKVLRKDVEKRLRMK